MKFTQRRYLKRTKIEIIPMIDTMFFLLVFFMLVFAGPRSAERNQREPATGTNIEEANGC